MVILKPEKGKLLIAEPSILNDVSFKRTTILLTEHSENSSVGFILNRRLQYTLNDLIPEINCDFTIYQGGPVEQENLYFIHRIPHLLKDSIEVANDIFWGGNFEELKLLLLKKAIKPTEIRFFLGYSGWGINQLEEELQTESWFVSENNFENVLEINEETIWKNKLLEKGGKYQIWANAPSDVQMN